ncbi:MAG TPA: BamA/TamA family outer membrane protein [Fimbriimonadaceae bacterium]|nr:BamA/TamA family outer membrane protein [Fimbriimonadaceae bacterium]
MERTVWLRGSLVATTALAYSMSIAAPADRSLFKTTGIALTAISTTPAGYPSFEMGHRPVAQVPGTVKEIVVKGNKVQTTQGILATMRTKVGAQFSQATLDLDKATLFDLGVFKAEPNITAIQNPDGTYSITVEVVENPVIKEIRLVGYSGVIPRAQILNAITIKPGDILSARAASISSQNVTELYRKSGYYARIVDLSYVPESPQTLNVQLLEDTVISVQVTGNTHTKKRVLNHLIKTRPGEAFNAFKWQKDMQRLFNTQWFSKIDPRLEPNSPPAKIALDVAVKETRTANLGVGLQVDPQSSFAGFIRFTDTNVGGTGQNIGAGFTQGTRGGGPSVDLDWANPFIDNHDTSMHLSLYSRVVYRFTNSLFGGSQLGNGATQYIERHTGASLGFAKPIGKDLSGSLTTRFEGVKTANTSSTNGNGFIQQDGTVATVGFGVVRDRRDTAIDSSRGNYMSLIVEPGYSNIDKVGGLIADQSYIGWSIFSKFSVEYRQYLTNGKPRPLDELDAPRKVVAFRIRAATIAGPVPFSEQYFAGGSDTVRGYDEDRYWGKTMLVTNLEYRYPIQKTFNLIGFVDYGGAWGGYGSVNTFTQFAGFNMHVGYGLGIAFKTPLGLIRLDLGVNEHHGTRTHFQIGPSF